MHKYNIGEYLYNILPPTYRKADLDTNMTLKKYLDVLGGSFGNVLDDTVNLLELIDVEKMPSRLLPYYGRMFGFEYDDSVPEDFQRKYLANIVDILKRKGTKAVIEFTARELTGMNAYVREGHYNLFKTWSTNTHDEKCGQYTVPKTFGGKDREMFFYFGGFNTDRLTVRVTLSATDKETSEIFLNTQLLARIVKDLVQPYINLIFTAYGILDEDTYTPNVTYLHSDTIKDKYVRKVNITPIELTKVKEKATDRVNGELLEEGMLDHVKLLVTLRDEHTIGDITSTDLMYKLVVKEPIYDIRPLIDCEDNLNAINNFQESVRTHIKYKDSVNLNTGDNIIRLNVTDTSTDRIQHRTSYEEFINTHKVYEHKDNIHNIEVEPPVSATIVLDKTSYSINQGQALVVNATMTNMDQYTVFELRQNNQYYKSAYRSGESQITCYTEQLNVGTYNNMTIVAKNRVNQDTESVEYEDIATSQEFTITVIGNSEGGEGTVSVTSISVSPSNKSANVGESFTITTSILPQNATNKSVTWQSSNSSVASVSGGTVYCNSTGSAIITATTVDGNKSASCNVTVSSSQGENNPPTETSGLILNMQYANQHECIPNTPESVDWKYKPRLGHGMTIPRSYIDNTPWKAFGQWCTVYKENNKSLVENVGVELTDFKMWRYDINTNQWKLINEGFDYGAFYLEDFWDDGNAPLPSNKILSSDKRTYKCLMNSATSGRCFHPFSPQIDWSSVGFDYVTGPCYVVSQVKFRLIKWDESGVDNRANAHLCVDVGGDYWIYKGANFDSQWRHNGDFAIGNYIKATSDWKYAYATSCPQNWDKGFPVDTV